MDGSLKVRAFYHEIHVNLNPLTPSITLRPEMYQELRGEGIKVTIYIYIFLRNQIIFWFSFDFVKNSKIFKKKKKNCFAKLKLQNPIFFFLNSVM